MAKLPHVVMFLLLLTLPSSSVDARPLDLVEPCNYVSPSAGSTADWLYIKSIISGGPSPGGKGHEFINAETLGNIKNSGLSAGGKGHELINSKALGNIEIAGPSPGGKGHDHITNTGILGSIKNSGPAPGGKGHAFNNEETLGDRNNLGTN